MEDDLGTELSKILAKTMQSSYKRKEIEETMGRIMGKTEKALLLKYDEEKIRELRREFEDIRKAFYGLK